MKNKRSGIFFSIGIVVLELRPFFDIFRHTHCKLMEPCEQNISRTAWARIMIFGSQIVSKV